MNNFISGKYISQGSYRSFQPSFINHNWMIDDMSVISLLSKADRSIGKLDMFSQYVPNIGLFISMHILKEATKSSNIEGTQTTVADAYKDKYERLLVDFSNHYPYNSMKWNYAHELRLLGEELGVKLYFYVARYTWATYADHLEVSHDVISKALGHADDNITDRHYIDFDWERVYRANRKVLDYVNGVSH